MYYSMSGCLDVHESWSKISSWNTTCGSVGLLVSLVTVSIMSCYNTSRTAGGVTCWCSRWVHPCEADVPAYCQHQPWCGKVGGCSDLTCYEFVLAAGEQWRQCLMRDLHGYLLSVRRTGRQAGERVGMEEQNRVSSVWTCVLMLQQAARRPLTPKVVPSHAWLTAW